MLQKYLSRTHSLSGRYRKHLANHLPMAIIALHQLGASDEAMASFFEQEIHSLEPLPTKATGIHRGNWKQHLGQPISETDYVAFFQDEIFRHGLEKTLAQFLPELIHGVIGGAFHPLIQTWYAFKFGEPSDLALALGNWACFYSPQPIESGARVTLAEALDRLQASIEMQNMKPQASLIQATGEQILSHPTFRDIVSGLQISTSDFEQLRLLLAKTYLGFQNFSLLHGITSAQALAGLLDLVVEKEMILSTYVRNLLAVYVSIGMPVRRNEPSNIPVESWEKIATAAIASQDEHIIKLVFTAKVEFDQLHDEVYQHIAWLMASGGYQYVPRYRHDVTEMG